MTETKVTSTPGPWEVIPPDSNNPSRAMVCARQVNIYNAPLTNETQANARLIAAAPDLLEALIDMVQANQDDLTIEHYNKARAAIAKAEGTE